MIILTLFSKIDIFKKSIRCSNKIIEKNSKKDLFKNNETRFL